MGDVTTNQEFLCPVCAKEFSSQFDFDHHKGSPAHRIKWLNRQYRKDRLLFVQEKAGLRIDVISENSEIISTPDDHTIEIVTENLRQDSNVQGLDLEHFKFTLQIVHGGKEPFYLSSLSVLNDLRLVESASELIVKDEHNIRETKKFILFNPGKHYDVHCTFKLGTVARALHIPLIFEFLNVPSNNIENSVDDVNSQIFYIGKSIVIQGCAYQVRDFGNYIEGVKPEHNKYELEREEKLFSYHIPSWFEMLVYNNNPRQMKKRMQISDVVTWESHLDFFRSLLWMEELQEELDIQYYSRKSVYLNFNDSPRDSDVKLVKLDEPGLAENRPCVLPRDKVFVCLSSEAERRSYQPTWYEGIVHKVSNTSILLGFHQTKFVTKFSSNTKFNVEFVIGRYTFQVCHRALDLCKRDNLRPFLFPSPEPQSDHQHVAVNLPNIVPYDTNINDNMEQIQAIQNIVAGSSGNSPYIVFGPPGTGKTVTVVEAIKQILYMIDRSYVLAIAPSNTAADVIAERLLEHFSEKHVFRIYPESRIKFLDDLPPKLLEASNYNSEIKRIFFPSKSVIMEKRVVVCTFITAARIAAAAFPKGHFSHLILDEVGHAMECEALVGIGGVLASDGHLVLAGDPHQLGPVIRNTRAMAGQGMFQRTGLDTSLLERLMDIPLYKKKSDGYNPKYVTKLVKNYRSHHTILKVPNDLFYNSELQPCGKSSLVNYLVKWSQLPKRNFPMIVHNVEGQDRMEKHSPSYHNPAELNQVMKYLRSLLSGQPKVLPEHIGIITPYRLQVEKLRYAVKEAYPDEFKKIKIGSVEDFQGEERRVIIVSTVRATNKHLAKDQLFKLGFLRNPKRFNVAVTRAQCLFILVGCTKVLLLDSNWKSLIDYVLENGGFIGRKCATPKYNIEDMMKQMQNLDIRPQVGDISKRQIVELPAMKRY